MGKLYLCRHHVRFADFTAIPGEVVEAELTEAAEKRLLALGALEAVELEAVELDNDPDAPQGGPAGENTPGADDAAQEPEDSAETEEENTEEEDTEAAEALAAAAAKACAAETPKRKRNQK